MTRGVKLTKQQRYYRKHKGKFKKYAKKYRKIAQEKAKELNKEKEKEKKRLKLEAEKEKKKLKRAEQSAKRKIIAKRKFEKKKYERRKRAIYFIATIRNNKPLKIFNRYVDFSWASRKWDEVLESQKNLFYPGFKYPLMFLYKVKPGEENTITQRNEIGKLVETKIPGYKIIYHDVYYDEKLVYFKNKSKRVPASFIFSLLNMNDNIKQCFLIRNKICVEDEDRYFLFVTSDNNTAMSIKDRLMEVMLSLGKTNVLFFNDIRTIAHKEDIYAKLVEQGICTRYYLISQ